MIKQAIDAAKPIVKGTSVDAGLLMQLASQPQRSKTLHHQLVTKLANDAEAELEKLYNQQIEMLDKTEDGDEGD